MAGDSNLGRSAFCIVLAPQLFHLLPGRHVASIKLTGRCPEGLGYNTPQ